MNLVNYIIQKKKLEYILLMISLKKTETDTCGVFQLYFFVNLFNPDENNAIIEDKILTQKTTEKLLNEIFSTSKEENERKSADFIDEKQIKMGE